MFDQRVHESFLRITRRCSTLCSRSHSIATPDTPPRHDALTIIQKVWSHFLELRLFSSRQRRLRPRAWVWHRVEVLECRQLLSVEPVATPFSLSVTSSSGIVPAATASPTGYSPQQIRHAYGFDQVAFGGIAGDGAGTTIAIVDAYDDPNIANDLHQFNLAFGLPDSTFTKVNQTGGSTMPAPNRGWITEIALDVEWRMRLHPGPTFCSLRRTAIPMQI